MRQKGEKVYLLPEEVLTIRSIHTQEYDIRKSENNKTWKKKMTEKMSLAKHGNATDTQLKVYLTLGSVFWIIVMLIGILDPYSSTAR